MLYIFLLFLTAGLAALDSSQLSDATNVNPKKLAKKVLFLHGTACAGKTSLCEALLQQSNDWTAISEDDIFYAEEKSRWRREFTAAFESIEQAIAEENILHAVMRNQLLFRTDVSDNHRDEAKRAIGIIQEALNSRPRTSSNDSQRWSNILRKKIMNRILDAAEHTHVIVDTWFLKQEHIDAIAERHELIHVMAYCPFAQIIKRTLQRNHDALIDGKNIASMRFFHQTLTSFTGFYELSDTPEGAIDVLSKTEAMHGCDLVSLCLHDSSLATGATKPFTRGEFSLQEFAEYRNQLLAQFKGGKAYIHAKRAVDIILKTDHGTPDECAQEVAQLVTSDRA